MTNNHNRKGVALISVMIVITLISASVSLMWQHFGTDLKQTQYILNQTQTLNHLYSMESWVKSILAKDDATVDSLDESWAMEIPPIQIPGGSLHGRIIDLQSRLNINNLIDLKTDIYSPQYRAFFYGCLNRLNTQLNQQNMADTIFSYVVSQSPKPKLFEHASTIKNIEAITVQDYITIKPYLIALPELTAININTASNDILSCLHPQLSNSLVDQIIEQRKDQPFTTMKQFWTYAQTLLPHLTLAQIKDNFPVEFSNTFSHYFLLETEIIVDKNKLLGQSIMQRKDGKITIMNRSYHQAP